MNDFRALQYHIATLQANPRPEEYYLEGYAWLRHSIAEAQAVLAQQYQHDTQEPDGDPETEKSLLKLYVSLFFFPFCQCSGLLESPAWSEFHKRAR
jgi:hypothetical protein